MAVGALVHPMPGYQTVTDETDPPVTPATAAGSVVHPPPENATVGALVYPLPPVETVTPTPRLAVAEGSVLQPPPLNVTVGGLA
jgi:hypothetical protein